MLKTFLSLILSILFIQAAQAGSSDSTVVYLKRSGQKAVSKDSADYYRVILPPDTNIDKDEYRVYEYYFNGKPKRVATSLNTSIDLALDGTCIDYFMNGKRKTTSKYKNGTLVEQVTNYYPNGNLYNVLKIENWDYWYYNDRNYRGGFFTVSGRNYKMYVLQLRDSTGNILATNGTGHVILFDEDFKNVLEEGDLKNDKKEGKWEGSIADSGRFECIFHKDALKSGASYMKSGNHYSFKEVSTRAVFSDGEDAFFLFIKKNVQYPESAKKHNISGSVLVEFYVETNGTISDVKAIRGLMKSCDEEAVRVVSMSPLWIPGTRFGIPVRTRYTVSVYFSKN